MGDDSSPTTDTEDEQCAETDVDAAKAECNNRTDTVGDFFYPIGKAVGFLGFTLLIGAVMEIGKRVGCDLYRSRY